MRPSLQQLRSITGEVPGEWPFWAATVHPGDEDVKPGTIYNPDIAIVGLNPSSGLVARLAYDFIDADGVFDYPTFNAERLKEKRRASRTRKRMLKTVADVASKLGRPLSIVNTNVVWKPSARVKTITDLLKYVMEDSRLRRLLEHIRPRLILAHGAPSIRYCRELPIPTFSAKTLNRSHFAFVSDEDLDQIKPEIVSMLQ
jgi:hypothetical protein